MKIRDGYIQIFEYIKKEDFFNFGINNIITIDHGYVSLLWKKLLNDINKKSNNLYIRDYGKNGSGNEKLLKLYKNLFDIDINFYKTNNQQPTKIIEEYTDYKKNKNLFNYQVSHVFGKTKNVYSFCAPWNIVYIPKIIDPLTGHEAKGEYKDEFKNMFQNKIYLQFKSEIDEYNEIMEGIYLKISNWTIDNIIEKERNNILKEFTSINIGI